MSSVGEQMSLFDQDIWFGKTCLEHSAPTKEKISGASSKRQQGSSKRMPIYLDLRRGGGHMQEASSWMVGASLGSCMTHSIGECHSAERGFVYWQISMGTPQNPFCLEQNIGDYPREPNPTLLSEILQDDADPRYNLSAKACRGILNRANKRGKKLPDVLREALEAQIENDEQVS